MYYNIDLFLYICAQTFHSVCRIADVLIELQHRGNSEYLRWKLQFPCAIPNVLELLKYQARKMETVFESWMNEVNEKRDEFYELNYYTTSQLLALSEGLGQFSSNLHGSPSIKPDVMNLLYSISQKVTLEEIKTVLKKSNIFLANTDLVDENSALFSSLPKTSSFAEADRLAHDSEVDGEEPVLKEKRKKTSQERMKSNCPKPQIQLGDLTQEQTSHFYNLKECGYHEKLILLAFERCKNRNIIEEVAKWCRILSEDYYFSDEDVSSSETEEEEEENYEEEEEELDQQKDSISETMKSPHSLSECFEEIQYIPVDENHPNVQILMSDYEFPLDQCIIAVRRHPNNIQLAMKYLTMGEAEDNSSTVHSLNSDEEEEIRGHFLERHASERSLEW